MNEQLQDLKRRLIEVSDLQHAAAVLSWDQSTYMPPKGAAARGRQMALLGRLSQEAFTSKEVGNLLDTLTPYAESLPYEDDDAALIRLTRRQYERMLKIPPAFMEKVSVHFSNSFQAWPAARAENNFAALQPLLEKTVEYSRQIADYYPGYEHIADPLIDASDFGMKASTIRTLFAELRAELVPLVEAIQAADQVDDSCIMQPFPAERQLEYSAKMAGVFGYDFQRGRQDLTHHPFMTKFSVDDVRITTRVDENNFNSCLFSTLHETGHALYELGVNSKYEGLPLANGTSAGVHESQSRLWENIVGRSYGYWEFYYPQLQEAFPDQFGDVSLDTYYRAINRVQPSLIRTMADEVTYNLHVMIRFDFELQLLEGSLHVKDLPEAWHARYESDLGLRAPDDRNGVMQDVHWFASPVGGAFQGYTLGNIMSALFYDRALAARPEIVSEMAEGRFDALRGWLTDNIYTHGSKFTASEVVERATGGPLTIKPYMAYLHKKFGELYGLSE